MDAITFQFLISLVAFEGLDMRLMDVVTAYLYGSIDTNIYMKIPEGFQMLEANKLKPRSYILVSIKTVWAYVVQSPKQLFIERIIYK